MTIGTHIYTSHNSFETARIVAAFEDAGIPVYIKEMGIGQMMNIVAGISNMPTKIYVPDETVGEAAEILADICPDFEAPEGEDAEK